VITSRSPVLMTTAARPWLLQMYSVYSHSISLISPDSERLKIIWKKSLIPKDKLRDNRAEDTKYRNCDFIVEGSSAI